MPNLTKRFVESITPDPHKLSQYWDDASKGLGLLSCQADGELIVSSIAIKVVLLSG